MKKSNKKKQSPTKAAPNKTVPSTSKTPSSSDKSKPSSSVKPKPLNKTVPSTSKTLSSSDKFKPSSSARPKPSNTLERQEANRSIPTPTAFEVRSGTVDFGKDYEVQIAALLGLRCLGKSTQDMWLGMNLKEGEDFDDVVVYRQTQDDKKRIYLIQLKFQTNPENINLREFKNEKGNFSLKKYLKSISNVEQNIKSQDGNDNRSEVMEYLRNTGEDVVYFIYTNRNLLDQSLCESIKPTNWPHKIILTDGKIFQFDHEKCPFVPELKKYSKKLYLLTEQIHINKLAISILKEIERLMQPVKLPTTQLRDIGKHLVSFITSWSKGLLGDFYLLRKDHIWKVVLERALTPYMVTFGEALDESASENQIWSKIVEDREVTIISSEDITSDFVNNYLQAEAQKYYGEYKALRADKTVEIVRQTLQTLCSDKIKIAEVYEFMWKSRRIPLLLKVSNIEDLKIVLQLVEKGKGIFHVIVLVSNVADIPIGSGKASFTTLKDLNEEHRKEILRQNVQLQGRRFIKLEDVVTNMEDAYGLTAKDIIYILSGRFNIGTDPPTLPETFIDRSFERVWLQNVVLTGNTENAFIIKCNTPNTFQSFIQQHKLGIRESQIGHWSDSNDDSFVDCDITIVEDLDLEKIRKLSTLEGRDIHYLVMHSNLRLEWVRSFGSVRGLKRFLDQSQSDKIKCQNVAELMHITNQNVPLPKLIVGCSGMGKSCLLDYVTARTSADVWILKINLPAHSDYFKDDGNFQNSSSAALCHLRYFADRCSTQQNKEISRMAFERYLDLRKIFIIFDAFDEVPLRYQSEAKTLIKSVNDCGFSMCVATRPVLKTELEELLDTFAVNLTPFSSWDQENYLLKYLSKIGNTEENDSLLKEFIEDLLKAVKINIKVRDAEFTRVPLLSKLLAEVFAEDYLEFRNSKSFHNRNFDLLYLYKHFIDEKTRIACEKGETVDLIDRYKSHKHFCALKILFTEEELEPLGIKEFFQHENRFFRGMFQMLQKDGIIIPDGSTGNVTFLHRSFAEFLVAEWLSENVKTEHRKVVQNLFKKVLNNNLMFVRNMFDRMLATKCPLHLAIINSNPDQVKEIIGQNPEAVYVNDEAGRSVLHIIASWGVYHLTARGYIESDVVMKALARWIKEDKVLDLLKLIPSDAIKSNKDDLLEFTPLDYAIASSCYHVANAFCERKEYLCQDISVPDIDYDVITFYMYKFLYVSLKSVVVRHVSIQDPKIFIDNLKSKRRGNDNLHDAIKDGNITKATSLMSSGYDVNETDQMGCTAVHIAVMLKEVRLLQLLLESGSKPNLNVKDKKGRTPLHWAAIAQHKESIQLLLSHSADTNAIDDLSRSALHYLVITAKNNTQNEVLRCFNEMKCMMTQDKFEKTPLHYAVHYNQVENLELILNRGISSSNSEILSYVDCDGATVLHWAASRGMKDAVKLLIDYGALLSQKDKYGRSALLCAIEECHEGVIELLIDREPALEIKNDLNETVLIVASKTGQANVVRLLLDKQIHIDDQDSCGMTALHWAAHNGHANVVSLLLSKSQNYEIRDGKGNTALIYASKNGYEDVVQLLLHAKAEINEQDALGKTPLHWATIGGNHEVVRVLLEAGANSNLKDKEGRTALMVAVEKGYRIIMNLFLHHLKNFEVADDRGSTVFLWAARHGRTDIILELINRGANHTARNFNGQTALMQAAKNNHVDTVRLLLDNGADIDARDKDNFTSFVWAVNRRGIQTAPFLLDKGANINIKTVTGESGLMLAAERGLTAVVNQLLVNGADVEGKNNQNMTPLHFAAKRGRADVVHLLLSKGANLEVKTNAGKTPLILASGKGHLQATELLIEKGAEINTQDNCCYTALHWAVYFRRIDVVRLLLREGANYTLKNKYQQTPLMIALQDQHADIAKLLLNVDVELDRSSLHHAAFMGHTNIVNLLISGGANLEAKIDSQLTPLMLASKMGRLDTVKLLIERHANMEAKDDEDRTALFWAASNYSFDVAKLLVDSGANLENKYSMGLTVINLMSFLGRSNVVDLLLDKGANAESEDMTSNTAWHYAAFCGHTDIIQSLLKKRAHFEGRNAKGRTPLLLGCLGGAVTEVEMLMDAGASTEVKDNNGDTCIHLAASEGHINVVKLLVSRRVSCESKNEDGKTAVMCASQKGHVAVVKTLLEQHIDIDAQDNDGMTCTHWAAVEGHADIVELLVRKGANLKICGRNGKTALMIALEKRYDDIERLLSTCQNPIEANGT